MSDLSDLIYRKYTDIWPSDHPLLLQNDIASWNIEIQINEKTGKYFENVDYFETDMAFYKRIAITLRILLDLDSNGINIIALQEVETEFVLSMATSLLYNRYNIFFEKDPGKPRGHVILCRKSINILNVTNSCNLILRDPSDNDIEEQYYFRGQDIYFCNPSKLFSTTLLSAREVIPTSRGETVKLVGFPLQYESMPKNQYIISVHIPRNSKRFPLTDEFLIKNTLDNITKMATGSRPNLRDNSYIILGDFNRRISRRSSKIDYILQRNFVRWEEAPRIEYVETRYIYESANPLLVNRLIRGHDLQEVDIDEILLCDSYRESLKNLRKDLIRFLLPDIKVNVDHLSLSDLDIFMPIETVLDVILDQDDYQNIDNQIIAFIKDGEIIHNEEGNKRIIDGGIDETDFGLFINELNGRLYDKEGNAKINIEREVDTLQLYVNGMTVENIIEVISSEEEPELDLQITIESRDVDNTSKLRKEIISKEGEKRKSWLLDHIKRFTELVKSFDKKTFRNRFLLSYRKLKNEPWFEKQYGRNSVNRNLLKKPKLYTSGPINLNEYGVFEKSSIKKDGNCLFNTLAQLIGQGTTYMSLRQDVRRYLLEAIDRNDEELNFIAISIRNSWLGYKYSYRNESNTNLVRYYADLMAQDPNTLNSLVPNSHYWGGELEIRILSLIHNRSINIVNNRGDVNELTSIDGNRPMGDQPLFIFYQNNHYEPLNNTDYEGKDASTGETKRGGYKINYTKI